MPRSGYTALPDTNDGVQPTPPPTTTTPQRETDPASVTATSSSIAGDRDGVHENLPIADPQDGSNFAEVAGSPTAPAASGGKSTGGGRKRNTTEGAEPGKPREDGARADRTSGSAAGGAAAGGKGAKGGREKEADVDLTGGLPTTEGVYVGTPVVPGVQQAMPRMPRSVPPHTAATILQTQPDGTTHILGQSQLLYQNGPGVLGADGVAIGEEGRPTAIVLNRAGTRAPWELWDRSPQQIVCPICSFIGYTRPVQDPCSPAPVLAAACCCLVGLWPCSFIPFLVPDIRDTVHRCPNCNVTLGRYRQCF